MFPTLIMTQTKFNLEPVAEISILLTINSTKQLYYKDEQAGNGISRSHI